MLKQTAVYWPPGSDDSGGVDFDDYGQPSYGTAVEVDCRWVDIAVEFVDSTGTVQVSHSRVYVGSDVKVGGMLFLGELTDLTDAVNPRNNDGAWEIKRFDKMPNFRATEYLRTAFL